MNIEKQIDYWRTGALSDLETAEILVNKRKFREGLFFCHLCIEKILKSIFVKVTNELAPKSHNLLLLNEKCKLKLSDKQLDLLGILMKYQLEGRYPGSYVVLPTKEITKKYFRQTKDLLKWLMIELKK